MSETKTKPSLDDGTPTDAADIVARITTALNALKSIGSTGSENVDADIMAAEQSLRRAKKKLT